MPGNNELIKQLLKDLSDRTAIAQRSFEILKEISLLASSDVDPETVQELILRSLEHADLFEQSEPVLRALIRRVGLFPYLDGTELSARDQLAYEYHRPFNMGDEIVFHRPQAAVYRMLLDGESVVLSAPTSFGKSLIIDAVIASGKFKNIVIVVPTIALIDETRRRLSRRFGGQFKIITHVSQSKAERNIYVLTQERLLELDSIDEVDFFVIDEFYKLAPGRADADDERCISLNKAFYRLYKKTKHFYMLGPGIRAFSRDFCKKVECHFIIETYHTVVSELYPIQPGTDELQSLVDLCRSLQEPTIVFTRSPSRATAVAKALIAANLGIVPRNVAPAAKWLARHYHRDWHFTKALKQGIGIHHGRIPRALAQYVVRQFNNEEIRFLVCTTTLIEGVNTKAKHIIILDNMIKRQEIDLFTFNNIRGRGGRMFEHFIGHVHIFHSPPETELPFVDVPAFSQPDSAPESLLIDIDSDDLSDRSKDRLRPFREQDVVSYEVLKRNGLDLRAQLSLAQEIASTPRHYHPSLSWTYMPTASQVFSVCQLIWEHFDGSRLASGSVFSAKQLGFLVNKLRSQPSTARLIKDQLSFQRDGDVDMAVQKVLDFLRLWARFHFPRLLRALDHIQRDIYSKLGMKPGSYEIFASSLSRLNLWV